MKNLALITSIILLSLFFSSCSSKFISNEYSAKEINIGEIIEISGKLSIKIKNNTLSGYLELTQEQNFYKISFNKSFLSPDIIIYIDKKKPLKIKELINNIGIGSHKDENLSLMPEDILSILIGDEIDNPLLKSNFEIKHIYSSSMKKLYPSYTLINSNNLSVKIAVNYLK